MRSRRKTRGRGGEGGVGEGGRGGVPAWLSSFSEEEVGEMGEKVGTSSAADGVVVFE